ncbi:hypothetical protein [Rhizobium mongolense]|jgi:hypothetical protein|uniref:Antitoxin VbhA domain-containing protein n=1 Tax=Rhizobium mongolense TaxID=57676 RepID=A0ABR6IWE0_9HYPH|nr:hypothetical protein [Rhizobium mongolense]MBB4232238.1 hypothetical protein [Rhizobium mongolense]
MAYSSKDLELSRRRVAEDRKHIAAQEAHIAGVLLRGEPSSLATEQLVDFNQQLRAHTFECDLIAAALRADRAHLED